MEILLDTGIMGFMSRSALATILVLMYVVVRMLSGKYGTLKVRHLALAMVSVVYVSICFVKPGDFIIGLTLSLLMLSANKWDHRIIHVNVALALVSLWVLCTTHHLSESHSLFASGFFVFSLLVSIDDFSKRRKSRAK